MTNKPMFSVEREVVEGICNDFEAGRHFKACEGAAKLRALLDTPAPSPCQTLGCFGNAAEGWRHCEAHKFYMLREPAAQHQDSPLSELNILRAAVKDFEAMRDARVDAKLAGSQGVPVKFDDWFRREIGDPNEVNCKGIESRDVYVARKAWNFKQPAPAIKLHLNVSNVKVTANADGSYTIDPGDDPAPVAVVMPEHTMRSVMDAIQQARGFPVLTSNQCHALAESLNYVARLNGVKP